MAKPEWGMKHECPNCSVRFYDLQKPSPITCISCGYEFATDVLHRVRKTKVTSVSEDDDDNDDDTDIDTDIDNSDDNLILDDDENDDEESVVSKPSTMTSIDDDMFPDDDDDVEVSEDIPEDLLIDEEDENEDDVLKNKEV